MAQPIQIPFVAQCLGRRDPFSGPPIFPGADPSAAGTGCRGVPFHCWAVPRRAVERLQRPARDRPSGSRNLVPERRGEIRRGLRGWCSRKARLVRRAVRGVSCAALGIQLEAAESVPEQKRTKAKMPPRLRRNAWLEFEISRYVPFWGGIARGNCEW